MPEISGLGGWSIAPPTLQIVGHDSVGGVSADERITSISYEFRQGEFDPAFDLSTSSNKTVVDLSIQDVEHKYVLVSPAEGITTLYYYATNNQGRSSSRGYHTFKVDRHRPYGTLNYQPIFRQFLLQLITFLKIKPLFILLQSSIISIKTQ